MKWLVGNPYYSASAVVAASARNARLLITNLMDGGDWTVIFLPEHASVPILLGAVLLPIAARRRRVPFHGLFVGMVALGSLVPCTYGTFLWNRIRYVWPFAGAWFVARRLLRARGGRPRAPRPPSPDGADAPARGRLRRRARAAPAVGDPRPRPVGARDHPPAGRPGAVGGVDTCPQSARIGVNDTGAIAYLSGRATFDVVGLTTEGEARYWVAGAGSRFEHYEKLPAERRPTHFIVYPQWMACAPVLGPELTEATVLDQSILGGSTMVAYAARWDLLGSGALPASPPPGASLVDEVDVADLESEAAHAYALGGGWDTDDQVMVQGEGAREVADGGRLRRTRDRFRVKLPAGRRARLGMRVSAEAPLDLVVTAGGREAGAVPLEGGAGWVEVWIDLPAGSGDAAIEVSARGKGDDEEPASFGAFHYWVYAEDAPAP